ncbi:hypothetical protein AB9M75_04040 [Lactobacillus sp. AN1001]
MRLERRNRKNIDKDTEIIIRNNSHGMFEVPGVDSTIFLENQNDEEFVTFGELRKLRKFLEKMDVMIVEVNSDEVNLYDVIKALRLKVYDDYFKYVLGENEEDFDSIDYIEQGDFEDYIVDCDQDEFEEILKSKLRNQVIETSVNLYKEHRLTDYAKMTLIRKTRPEQEQSEFWNDIDETINIG